MEHIKLAWYKQIFFSENSYIKYLYDILCEYATVYGYIELVNLNPLENGGKYSFP